ncbi:MAG: PDDEXK nuclease domain-containing protein [Chitinophagaceae bacterium]|nr:PDDEXK nuclease domain-containing protein [Chitinophagaceae bacterium]
MAIRKKNIYIDIKTILEQARESAVRSVNFAMVIAYWKIGERIVEEELKYQKRAGYGEKIIDALALRLTNNFGKGFTSTNLRYMRLFYLAFPIHHSLRDESAKSQIGHSLRGQSKKAAKPIHHSLRDQLPAKQKNKWDTLRPELSWTHYRLLLAVENIEARKYYMNEAAENNWSTRLLERQINSFYYERLLSSKNKKEIISHTKKEATTDKPSVLDFIKDPYILEFLNLSANATLYEKELETELLNKLQHFLLEMGKGFSFVARQQRISADGDDFFVDIVFYNYILKCFVLIDLKTGKLTHQDIGQMDFYVRYYEEKIKQKADNPTIGIILCAEKNETIARYSVLTENKRLFASKYKLYLPSEKELAKELKAEIEWYNKKKAK